MMVYLPISESPTTGKGFFLHRLSVALRSLGVDIVTDARKRHDVSLHLTGIKTKTKSKKIIRFDGIYHNLSQNFQARNAKIKRGSADADGVIYQSRFSKRMCEKYIRVSPVPSKVIFNGADITFSGPSNKPNFMAFSRWRPHKRLLDIIESFLVADIKDSSLFIAGDLDKCGIKQKRLRKFLSDSRIVYLGRIGQKKLLAYLGKCCAVVHLCWLDWCPNSVVESIAAGKVVISNNVGGTPELVRLSGGLVCNIDKPYNGLPVKLYKPPPIDRNVVAAAMRKAAKGGITVNNIHVNIDTTARQYKEFFELV